MRYLAIAEYLMSNANTALAMQTISNHSAQ